MTEPDEDLIDLVEDAFSQVDVNFPEVAPPVDGRRPGRRRCTAPSLGLVAIALLVLATILRSPHMPSRSESRRPATPGWVVLSTAHHTIIVDLRSLSNPTDLVAALAADQVRAAVRIVRNGTVDTAACGGASPTSAPPAGLAPHRLRDGGFEFTVGPASIPDDRILYIVVRETGQTRVTSIEIGLVVSC